MVSINCNYKDLNGHTCEHNDGNDSCTAHDITILREASSDEYTGYDYPVCQSFVGIVEIKQERIP